MSIRTSSLSTRTTLPLHDLPLVDDGEGRVVIGDQLAVWTLGPDVVVRLRRICFCDCLVLDHFRGGRSIATGFESPGFHRRLRDRVLSADLRGRRAPRRDDVADARPGRRRPDFAYARLPGPSAPGRGARELAPRPPAGPSSSRTPSDCRLRVIGLAGGRERRPREFAGNCDLWAPPVGDRIAYGLGPSSADGFAPFRLADLVRPDAGAWAATARSSASSSGAPTGSESPGAAGAGRASTSSSAARPGDSRPARSRIRPTGEIAYAIGKDSSSTGKSFIVRTAASPTSSTATDGRSPS